MKDHNNNTNLKLFLKNYCMISHFYLGSKGHKPFANILYFTRNRKKWLHYLHHAYLSRVLIFIDSLFSFIFDSIKKIRQLVLPLRSQTFLLRFLKTEANSFPFQNCYITVLLPVKGLILAFHNVYCCDYSRVPILQASGLRPRKMCVNSFLR